MDIIEICLKLSNEELIIRFMHMERTQNRFNVNDRNFYNEIVRELGKRGLLETAINIYKTLYPKLIWIFLHG
jgi:hypothetical protein